MANRDEVQLRGDDAAADRRRDLLRGLLAQTDVAVAVADGHVAHEARALPGAGLPLHRHDLHHVILQVAGREERIDDLELLDREGVQVDVLDRGDAALLHEAAELRARNPLLLVAALALALALLALALALAEATAEALALALALLALALALAEAPAEALALAVTLLAAHGVKTRNPFTRLS